jgi:Flp pilus assembly protein CpaB
MRLSMLAVIAVAVMIGLGVVFAVKALGLLNPPPPPPPPAQPEPPKPAPVPPPPPPPNVVVPVRVLFSGDNINPSDVTVRPLRPEELKDYERHQAEYLPPAVHITYFRTTARDILPDVPLKYSDLTDPQKPKPLAERLAPGTRAVSVAVPKEHSAGGLIQVGDWVDVYILTDVSRTDDPTRVPYAGLLVPRAQVIAKRDTLYSIYAPLLPGELVPFTLATNPFRAELLEYGRTVGTLALVPVSADEKKRLDALREAAMTEPGLNLAVPFAAPGSKEYEAELARIDRYTRGTSSIGAEELASILNLPKIEPPVVPEPPAPPPEPPPPPPPVTIEKFSGTVSTGVASFPVPYVPPPRPKPAEPTRVQARPAKYTFSKPDPKTGPAVTPKK